MPVTPAIGRQPRELRQDLAPDCNSRWIAALVPARFSDTSTSVMPCPGCAASASSIAVSVSSVAGRSCVVVDRIAERVRALAEETDAVVLHVQPCPHAIAVRGRRGHRQRSGDRQPADAREARRAGCRPSAQLTLVAHVREDGAAAIAMVRCRETIRRRCKDLRRPRPDGAALNAFDRASTVSPGIAPATSTIAPSWRAIILPPAAGFSTASVTMWPGTIAAAGSCDLATVEAHDRKVEVIADAALECGAIRALKRLRRHPFAKRRQRLFCRALDAGSRRLVERRLDRGDERRDRESRADRSAHRVPVRARYAPRPPARRVRAPSSPARDRARVRLRPARQRSGARSRARYARPASPDAPRATPQDRSRPHRGWRLSRSHSADAHGPPPAIERVKHIRFAEFDRARGAAAGLSGSSARSTDRCLRTPR